MLEGDGTVLMLLGWLVGGVRATPAYYGLVLVCADISAVMASANCCLAL